MNQPDLQAWQGKNRLALLIGIDDYPGDCIHSLQGCVNDIEQLQGILESKYHFAVVCLLDAAATREAILAAMTALADCAKPGDQVVFGFSGHGAILKVEEGRVFETLVPCDSSRTGRWPDNRDITDRELFGWAWQVSEKTPLLTLIIDGCRSGSMLRTSVEARPRFAAAENGKNAAVARDKRSFVMDGREPGKRGPSGWLPVSDRYTLLAACRAEEFCREIEDKENPGLKRGLFSYHLQKALIAQHDGCTWRELFAAVELQVTARDPSQHPQLEGLVDRVVFGQDVFQPKPFLPLLARDKDQVELGGGGAQGVVRGSIWSLFPADCRQPDPARRLGQLRIETVGAVRSQGILLEGSDLHPEIALLRAFETSRPIDRSFRVQLGPSARGRADLRKEIEKSAYLSLSESSDPDQADSVVHLLPARKCWSPGEDLPQVGRIAEKSWAFLSPSQAQLAPLQPFAGKGGVERAIGTLETLARHRFLKTLCHPDPALAATRTFEVEAFRLSEDEAFRVTAAHPLDENPLLPQGARIAFRVRHHHPNPLEILVISLGPDGSIEQVFPPRGKSILNLRTTVVEIGFAAPEALVITVPESYPIPGEPKPASADECLLFLATEESATNLELSAQEGVRSKVPRANLFQLAWRMTRGRVTRDLPPIDVLKELTTWGVYRWDFRLQL